MRDGPGPLIAISKQQARDADKLAVLVEYGASRIARPDEGLETWDVVPGGSAAAVYTFRQPGLYAYLNHNLIMAFVKDAKAFIHVDGEWTNELMEQTSPPRPRVQRESDAGDPDSPGWFPN